MSLEKLHKQVWVFHDFIEGLDLNTLISNIESSSKKDWFNDSVEKESFWYGRNLHKSRLEVRSQQIIEQIELSIKNSFSNYEKIHEIQSILKTTSDGKSLGEHKDNTAEGDLNNIFGLVVYLNDNYGGGEIFYKDLEFSYKPKLGDLVVHYAGLTHGVKPVTSGDRYVLTSFVKGNKQTTFMGEESGI